jgi:hypothetical protein
MRFRIDGPIIPGRELGGIAVGMPVLAIADMLTSLSSKVEWRLSTLFEATYYVADVGIEVVVDVRNGKVSRLTARRGYRGTLQNGIAVGMQVSRAVQIEPRFYYDEAEELLLCRDVLGIALEVSEIDPIPSRVPEMPVHAISVFAPEIATAAGQRGTW